MNRVTAGLAGSTLCFSFLECYLSFVYLTKCCGEEIKKVKSACSLYIYWHYINDIYICHPKPRADQTKMRFLKVLSIDSKACWSKQQLSSTSTPAAVAAVASEVLCRFDAGWQASQNFVPCRVIQLTSLVCPKLLQFQ